MKRFFLLVLISSFLFPLRLKAQEQLEIEESPSTVVTEIMEGSGGDIEIIIPDDINRNLFPNLFKNNEEPAANSPKKEGQGSKVQATTKTGKTVRKMQGFRIQVFNDGRNPQTLQARARARGNAIVAKFPKYRGQIYTFSSSPNWYTRVGNFETHAEASKALGELKRAFPAFAAEMRVVKSQVTIVK